MAFKASWIHSIFGYLHNPKKTAFPFMCNRFSDSLDRLLSNSEGKQECSLDDPVIVFSASEKSSAAAGRMGSQLDNGVLPDPQYAYHVQGCPGLCTHREKIFQWMLSVETHISCHV